MTAKRDPVLVRIHSECGVCPEKWNAKLLEFNLPSGVNARREDVQEGVFYDDDGALALELVAGLQWRPGEQPRGLAKVVADFNSFDYTPTPEWLRSQSFMHAVTLIVVTTGGRRTRDSIWKRPTKSQRAELLKLVDDLVPNEPLPLFDPVCWSDTAEDFIDRWRGHLVDVEFRFVNRDLQRIELWSASFPPDEPDDYDEDDGDAPAGHWEGLRFVAD
jgi:hypothetical protein